MAGSIYGKLFQITTWGESHQEAIGVVIDGCPAGLSLTEADIQSALDRRKPGQNSFSTARKEDDRAKILSGVFQGTTTGTPISILIPNKDHRSSDYSSIATTYRPGHADYTFDEKYKIRDYRGGGRSSGRETAARVAAGAVALKILSGLGIKVTAYVKSIGPYTIPEEEYHFQDIGRNPLSMPNLSYAQMASDYLFRCMQEKDSAGGVIECRVTGLPSGLGEPVFDKLDASLAKAILSIGAVKGFEMGDGFKSASLKGSRNNDSFYINEGSVSKRTNHSGGTLGGISDGSPLVFRAAFKPTPSISRSQETVNSAHESVSLTLKGRHDPVIVPRAVVVVESMAAITITDLLFQNMLSRMDYLKEIYKG